MGGEESVSSSRTLQQGGGFPKQTFKPGYCGRGIISLPIRPGCGPINPYKISNSGLRCGAADPIYQSLM